MTCKVTPTWSLNTLTCAAADSAMEEDKVCRICGRKTAASSADSTEATSEAWDEHFKTFLL